MVRSSWRTHRQVGTQLAVELQVVLVLAQLLRVHLRRRRGRQQRQRIGARRSGSGVRHGGDGCSSGSSLFLQCNR